MRKVYLVVVRAERVRKRECIITTGKPIPFSFKAILIIANLVANSMPTEFFGSIAQVLGETKNSHPFIVQRVWLGQVQDVKLYSVAISGVSNSEEEPLRMAVCVYVVLKN